jgi:hypothetical protein
MCTVLCSTALRTNKLGGSDPCGVLAISSELYGMAFGLLACLADVELQTVKSAPR